MSCRFEIPVLRRVARLDKAKPRPDREQARSSTGPALDISSCPPRPLGPLNMPALDGIRGIAVAAVLLFHGGFAWAKGGFLGVSTFFTLSGPSLVNDFGAEQHQLTVLARRFSVTSLPPTLTHAATGRPPPVSVSPPPVSVSPPSVIVPSSPPVPVAAGTHVPVPRLRFAVFGDSSALEAGLGIGDVLHQTGEGTPVGGQVELGCGLVRAGDRSVTGGIQHLPDRCNDWPTMWARAITALRPTVACVLLGPWEIEDYRLPGDSVWRQLGDPFFDQYLLSQMTEAVDILSASGADVIWLTSPPIGAGSAQAGQPQSDLVGQPQRMALFNQLVEQLPSLRAGKVHIIDLAAYLASTGEDATLRPDGVHLGQPAQADQVARTFLVPAILSAYPQDWRAAHG